MAGKNGKSQLQNFVKGQLHDAQKRWSGLENEAGKILKNLMARGQKSRKEMESLLHKLNAHDLNLLENPTVKRFGKRANKASVEVRKRLDTLHARVIEVSGAASQNQIKEISREINRLSKKVDSLTGKKADRDEVRA